MKKICCAALLAAVFAGACAPDAEAQAPDRNSASLVLRWIDARGNLFPGGKVLRMAWVWGRVQDKDPVESPALRLWIASRLPADWIPRKTTGEGAHLSEPFKEGETQTFAVDLRGSRATLRMEFADKNGRTAEMTLSINVSVVRPYILVRPECNQLDLRFLVHKAQARHLFVGLHCIDLGDSFDIYFFRSRDSIWNPDPSLVQFDPQGRFTAFKYHVAKPKAQVVYSQRLFRVGTLDDQKQPTEYSVFYNPKVTPNVFYVSAGMGATYYTYNEKPTRFPEVKKTQIGLTAKANVGVRLVPRVLDFAFNGFGTVFTLTHSGQPQNLPEARFLGLNGRIGYRLPMDLGAVEFMFLTGAYFWSMSVADNSYGVKALGGPQLFLTMISSQAGHAGFWVYTKFAMISDQFNISNLANREIAVGTGIELSARETKPLALTLDIAQVQFTLQDNSNSMKLLSITAGVQKAL